MYYTIAGNNKILIETNYKNLNNYFLDKLKVELNKIFSDVNKNTDNNKLKSYLIQYNKATKNKNNTYDLSGNNINCNLFIDKIIKINK